MGLKYQDIETLCRGEIHPNVLKVIQHLHAENAGLKQEITGITRGIDRIVDVMNQVLTVATAHNQIFTALENGKSMSDAIGEMRAEHLSGVVSEEVKN
jgi:hypothetical protein